MKRLSSLDKIVLIAITFSILAYPTLTVTASTQHFVPIVDASNAQFDKVAAATETLHVITTENVTMLNDGRCLVTLLTVVPSSLLADIYRKSLGVPTPADGESRIPEKRTETVDVVGNATEIGVTNRDSFYRGIEQEQSFFLGRILEIFDSRVVPRGNGDDFRISVSAFASPQVITSTELGSDIVQEIGIGPMDPEASLALARFLFSKVAFIQMMLRSLEGQQVYDYTWITRIDLPSHGTLLNRDKLDGLNWEMDFGGGTCMTAAVSIDETSTVILNERTLVSENDITATPKVLLEDSSTYKTFNIRCQLPRSASIHSEILTSADDWSYSWDCPLWSQSIELTFSEGPLSATLTVTPSLIISGYVGWDLDLGGLDWFEAWMSVTASVNVEFETTATASYSYAFQQTLFEWKTTYSFWVGLVFVWADLQFTSSASFTIDAYAKISFYAQAEAQATFKAGVKWTRTNGWSGISEITTSASKTGPNISAHVAGASVRPAIKFRLAFLFYGVAGPFVECEAYVNAAITYILPNGSWEVSVNFKIVAGSTFAGWLNFLGLDDWSVVIYERQLASWNGTWGMGADFVYLEGACDKLQYGSSWSEVFDSSSSSDLVMRASASSSNGGCLYGPYMTTGWDGVSMLGKPYIATFRLKVSSNASAGVVAYIDVGYNAGPTLQSRQIRADDFASPNTWQDFKLTFIAPSSLSYGLEFRVVNYNDGVADLNIDYIAVGRGWNASTVYLEAAYNKRQYPISWSRVADVSSWAGIVTMASASSPNNCWLYGPYITTDLDGQSLLGKSYVASFRLKVSPNTPLSDICYLDVCYDAGAVILRSQRVKASDFTSPNTWQDFQLTFTVPNSMTYGLEFRVTNLNNGVVDLYTDSILISQGWDASTVCLEGAYNKRVSGSSWSKFADASSWSGTVMKASAFSASGAYLYGPYIKTGMDGQSLLGKPYTVGFGLKVTSNLGTDDVCYLDVCYDGGAVILKSTRIEANDFTSPNAWQEFQLTFVAPSSLTYGLEFRVINLNSGVTDLYVDRILVKKGWDASNVYVEGAYNKRVSGSSWSKFADASSWSGMVMKASSASPSDGWLYGPYTTLDLNGQTLLGKSFTATFRLKVSSNVQAVNVAYIDVCYDAGAVILKSMRAKASDFTSPNAWQDFQLTFTVPSSLTYGLELRVVNLNNAITDLLVDIMAIKAM